MAPELAPFMADELLLSMPEVEGIDYTMKEYMKLVDQTKQCVERLNAQGEDPCNKYIFVPCFANFSNKKVIFWSDGVMNEIFR